jgi:outer membrane protein assembly factor BamB
MALAFSAERARKRAVSFLAPVLLTTAALAADWPQFRGPASNPVGDSTQLPEKWSKTENVEWMTPLEGRGWSSPIVTGGKVYVTAAITVEGTSKKPQTGTEYSNEYVAELMKKGLSQQEVMQKVNERDFEMPSEVKLQYVLYCLDLKSGKVEWRKEFFAGRPPGGRHRKNSFTSETPATDGKAIYIYTGNLGLWAFDLKGKQLWHTPVENNPIYLEFGTASSPVLAGNQVIIVSDNQKQQYIASFDKRTGQPLWKTARDIGDKSRGEMSFRSGWATPYLWQNGTRTEIVTVGPGLAISYDLEGKELWRMSGIAPTPIPMPFSAAGLLFIDAGRGRPLYAIKPGASGDISLAKDQKSNDWIAWSEARGGTYLPTPVYYDGALYILNEVGIFSRLDAKTGRITYRSRISTEAGNFTSSPWAYNGRIFCLNEEGKTFVVSAGEKFELLHENLLDEFSMATPALVGDRLVLRTEGRLYSFRQAAPKKKS